MARDEGPKSKLIDLLKKVSHGPVSRMGLVPREAEKVPAMLLLASFKKFDAKEIQTAFAAGADAVVLSSAEGMGHWDEVTQAVGDKPIGLLIAGSTAPSNEQLKQYVDRAPDFVVATPSAAPASLLTAKGIGKVLSIGPEYTAQLVRALGEMDVDAVLAETATADGGGPLTVRDLLHCRQIVDLVRRPVLIEGSPQVTTDVLPVLRDMGVEGLLLPISAGMKAEGLIELISTYRKGIDDLGKSIGRGRESSSITPVIPRHGPTQTVAPEPDEEPDDE